MSMQGSKVEWLHYPYSEVNGWRLVRMAIDGKVASFEIRDEDWRAQPTEEAANAMLIRLGKSYLEEFGDFRSQKGDSYNA